MDEWYTVFQVSGIIYIIGGFVYLGNLAIPRKHLVPISVSINIGILSDDFIIVFVCKLFRFKGTVSAILSDPLFWSKMWRKQPFFLVKK